MFLVLLVFSINSSLILYIWGCCLTYFVVYLKNVSHNDAHAVYMQ